MGAPRDECPKVFNRKESSAAELQPKQIQNRIIDRKERKVRKKRTRSVSRKDAKVRKNIFRTWRLCVFAGGISESENR